MPTVPDCAIVGEKDVINVIGAITKHLNIRVFNSLNGFNSRRLHHNKTKDLYAK